MKINKQFIPVTGEKDKKLVFREPGVYAVFFHNLSGELRLEIKATQVKLHIFGLYTGKGVDRFKLSTLQLHEAPSSSSDLYVKGVFEDDSSFIYEGLIRIEKNGDGSHAYQKNQNLILSENVFVSSKPDLEILAQDVYCTHGSTTGRPNLRQQFYLQSRGLDKKECEKLYISGFIQHLFSQIEDLGFGKEVNHYKEFALKNYA